MKSVLRDLNSDHNVIPFGKEFMQTHNFFYDLALNIIGNIAVSLLMQFLADIL